MTDAEPIDDRRRFKELWKELVYARIAPAPLMAVASCWLVWTAEEWGWLGRSLRLGWLPLAFCVAIVLAVPSAIAIRNYVALFAVAGLIFAGYASCVLGAPFVMRLRDTEIWILSCVIFGSATGTAEGLLTKARLASTVGLVVGAATGALFGTIAWDVLPGSFPYYRLASPTLVLMAIEVALGYSLATCHRISDRPRQRAGAQPPPDAAA